MADGHAIRLLDSERVRETANQRASERVREISSDFERVLVSVRKF